MQLNISIKKGGCYPGECTKLPEIQKAAFLCAKSKALDYKTQALSTQNKNCGNVVLLTDKKKLITNVPTLGDDGTFQKEMIITQWLSLGTGSSPY